MNTPDAIMDELSSQQPILEAIHLRKYFPLRQIKLYGTPSAVHAVEDNTLALYPGRALALVGESGSGKTTMAPGTKRSLPAPDFRVCFI